MTSACRELLAPAYTDWPDVVDSLRIELDDEGHPIVAEIKKTISLERCVNVLCEGPSIVGISKDDLLPGPVVAINHTISLSDRIPIDFWALVDVPGLLWKWAQPHLHDGCRILTSENNLKFWEDLIGKGIYERVFCIKPTYMRGTDTEPAMLDDNGRPALIPTMVHVLSWVSQIPGVERVRLFGCDMRGSGSPLSREPYSTAEDIGWRFRWNVERRLLALVHKKYKSKNQRLERWAH